MTAKPAWARLWDGPTRLVHWGLVVLIAFSWWSAETGRLPLHRLSGYAIIGLLLFRIAWGFIGADSARFARFVKGPRETLAYVRTLPARSATPHAGHNPLGAVSVLAILLVLLVQVATGLLAVDVDGMESGPLSAWVSFEAGRLAAKWHHWSFSALQVLVVLHLAAIGFYQVYKRVDLIAPMITGRRRFDIDPGVRFAPPWRAAAAAALAATLAWVISTGLRF